MNTTAAKNSIKIKHLKLSDAARVTGESRRQSIVGAAVGLFAKHGFRGTTTREIAQAADVSEASLFQYFKTKADLYAAVLAGEPKDNSDDWLKEISEYAAAGDDENVFQAIAVKIAEHYRRDAEFLRLMLYSALEGHAPAKQFYEDKINSISGFLCRYIKRRQLEEAFQKCDAAAAAEGFIGAQLHRAMTQILFGGSFVNTAEQTAIADFTRLTLDGLRSGIYRRKKYTGIF